MSVNVLVRNDNDVASLQSAIHYGTVSLKTIPGLLKAIIRDEEWRERVLSSTGEVVTFRSFPEFVTSPMPGGLNADMATLKRLCGDDPEALDLIDQAEQRPPSVHAFDNIQGTEAPTGTSKQAALRRLRRDQPDLHERVLTGKISAHAAMVEAGFRPKTITVRTDPSAFARAARKHLSDDQIEQLVEMLEAAE